LALRQRADVAPLADLERAGSPKASEWLYKRSQLSISGPLRNATWHSQVSNDLALNLLRDSARIGQRFSETARMKAVGSFPRAGCKLCFLPDLRQVAAPRANENIPAETSALPFTVGDNA
jgi:hypothetical protein